MLSAHLKRGDATVMDVIKNTAVQKRMKNRIAVDMGGTKIEIMLTGATPLDVIQKERVRTEKEFGYQHLVSQLAHLILKYVALCDEPPLIGIGIPGSINPQTHLVRNANTTCLIGHPLQEDLEKLVGLPINFENDANCLALSEATFGAGKGYKMVMGIILGTGLGGGLVIDGKLWTGTQGIAGEWGHLSMNFNGPKCWCGNNGCMEMYLSGTAAEANYKAKTGKFKKLNDIYLAYETKSDPHAVDVIEEYLKLFGYGVANLISSYDPDIVVLGGGVSNIPILYTQGVEKIAEHVFNDGLVTPIVQNKLGDSSGIFGAAIAAG